LPENERRAIQDTGPEETLGEAPARNP